MFYSSRFMTALSDLGGPIAHLHKSDEDSMFAAAKQSKAEGLKPADAALSYFIAQAEDGIRNDPERWRPIAHKALLTAKVWLQQERVRKQSAVALVDLLRSTEPDGA